MDHCVDRLAALLTKRYGHIKAKEEYFWPAPALKVLDCVLSLNRAHHSFVVPRVERFAERRPTVTDIAHLKTLMNQHNNQLDFCIQELDYWESGRAHTLRGVVEYLLKVQGRYQGPTERERLRNWACAAAPSDSALVGVKGFGLSGFQYMRMLFGAQTTKPDVHISRFVSKTCGAHVNDQIALDLLERAAERAGVPLRDVDYEIWRERART